MSNSTSSTSAQSPCVSAVSIAQDSAELVARLKLAPRYAEGFVTHFTQVIHDAFSSGSTPAKLSKVLKKEAKIWSKEGQCSLVSDPAQVPFTLAPHFTAWMSCTSEEDQHGEGLIDAGVWPNDDDAVHGDACRHRAALEEFADILMDEFDVHIQSLDEDNLNLFVTISEDDFDELPEWVARLGERGWDTSASGDRFGDEDDTNEDESDDEYDDTEVEPELS